MPMAGRRQPRTALKNEAPSIVILNLRLTSDELYDAAFAIRTIDPTTVLISCSGYLDMLDQTVARLPAAWGHASLWKPFPPEQLAALLNALYRRTATVMHFGAAPHPLRTLAHILRDPGYHRYWRRTPARSSLSSPRTSPKAITREPFIAELDSDPHKQAEHGDYPDR
jgi:DNA-binding response OmpR family regulator